MQIRTLGGPRCGVGVEPEDLRRLEGRHGRRRDGGGVGTAAVGGGRERGERGRRHPLVARQRTVRLDPEEK